MKYSIYQIVLTSEECDEINGMSNPHEDHPKFRAHRLTMDGKFNEGFGFYKKVSEIEGNDLEHVFQIGNIGPEEKITRLRPMHSISVGDIIITGTGEQYGVEDFGFAELENVIL